jgi:hypothetical protein
MLRAVRKLNRNYWRLGWILLTNGAVIILFLSGPIRTHHQQQLLYQAMRTAPPRFSYLHEFFADPWGPLLVFALLAGVLAEARRTVLSPILNLGPYAAWFVAGLWEHAKAAGEATTYEISLGRVFLAVLAFIIAIGSLFYAIALRRTTSLPVRRKAAQGSD